MPFKSFRKESRSEYGREMQENEHFSLEQLNTGAFLRIADAVEKMSVNHDQLMRTAEYYQAQYKFSRQEISSLNRQISALKGVITKMKKGPK